MPRGLISVLEPRLMIPDVASTSLHGLDPQSRMRLLIAFFETRRHEKMCMPCTSISCLHRHRGLAVAGKFSERSLSFRSNTKRSLGLRCEGVLRLMPTSG